MDTKTKVVGAAALALALVLWLKGRGKAETLTPFDVELSNLVISPLEVVVGHLVAISVDVTNTGQTAGSYTVALTGDVMGSKPVSLQPAETKTVDFTFTPTTPGTYNMSVDGLSGSFEAVEVPITPTDIRVDSVTVTPSQVNLGEVPVATMSCTNYGSLPGSKDVICSIMQNGSGLTDIHVPVSLAANESKDIQILQTYGLGQEAGSFIINADDKSCTLNVLGGNCGVTGIIKSSGTGQPLVGAIVSIADIPEYTVTTDATGRFTITGWDDTVLRIDVSYPGYGEKIVGSIYVTSDTVKDIGVIMLDPIEMSHLVMSGGCWVLDGNTKYVGGYGQTQVNIGFAFKNMGTGVGNGGATFGIEVFKSDGSLFSSSMNVACPSVNPGATIGSTLHFDVGAVGTYTVKTYFNGVLVNTLTVNVVMVQLSMSWAPKPPATLALGQGLTAGVKIHNPSPERALFTLTIRSQWYTDSGTDSIVLVTQSNLVIQAGATLSFSGSFVPGRVSVAGSYEPFTHIELSWGGYHGGEASLYAATTIV